MIQRLGSCKGQSFCPIAFLRSFVQHWTYRGGSEDRRFKPVWCCVRALLRPCAPRYDFDYDRNGFITLPEVELYFRQLQAPESEMKKVSARLSRFACSVVHAVRIKSRAL